MTAPDDAELATLATAVARHLTAAGRTFVAAESCTGGWIAKACTDLPGSSRWFLGSAVVYANGAKTRLLGVPEPLLAQHGAVSEPVAVALAEGIKKKLDSDIGIGVTGIAGPSGGTPAKPVGTVAIAVVMTGVPTKVRTFSFPGARAQVKFQSTQTALDMVRRMF